MTTDAIITPSVRLDPELRAKVADQQLRMVWSHATIGTLIATIFAVVMALHFAELFEWTQIKLWLAAKIMIAVPRMAQAQIFRLQRSPGGAGWRRATLWMLFLDGIVWGTAGLWLTGENSATTSLAIASLLGIVCVATFGLQVSRMATASYVVPIMVPMIAGLLLREDAFGRYYAAGLSLFLFQVLVTATRSEAKLAEVFLLRIHATRVSAEKAEALDLARRQSAVKSRFLGTVSHELRTPIHGMLGIARLMHVESPDPLVKKRMELIEATGTHLLGLVTDLIDVSRAGSEQMRIQRIAFNLSTEVQRVAEIYEVRAAEKGLAFSLESNLAEDAWVLGDPARMRQVLHNLLGNAIKFTKEGAVRLRVDQGSSAGQLHFEVRDTGIGVSEEDQKVIFNAFEQVSLQEGSARREGTGLGLTIASEIARLLGGSIAVRSKPGSGSVFTFSAQFAPISPPLTSTVESACETKEATTHVQGRILLVEDNDVNALIASSMLTNQGHRVERVCDGAEAVHRALREIDRFDLILMDCMMPNMDGFQATESIRSQELAMGSHRIPIIALSAIIDEDVREKAIQAGMDDALGKPFGNDELADVIRPWLSRNGNERQGASAHYGREFT